LRFERIAGQDWSEPQFGTVKPDSTPIRQTLPRRSVC
jgi:hypothetical protein